MYQFTLFPFTGDERPQTAVIKSVNAKMVEIDNSASEVPLHYDGKEIDKYERRHRIQDHLSTSEERQGLVPKESDINIVAKSEEPEGVSNQTTKECVMSDD